MEPTYYAAIDIGSNAVRLQVKRLEDAREGRFSRVVMMRVPLRLGQESFTAGRISEKKSHDLKELMRAYAIVMGLYDIKPDCFRGCATAAMREASNGHKVLENIERLTGVRVEIITGQEEAQIVCSTHCDVDKDLMYVDVGGGSTEVSIISGGELVSSKSYPLGSVRVLTGSVDRGVVDTLVHDMKIAAIEHPGLTVVGAGGNINKLYEIAEDRDASGRTLSLQSLRAMFYELSSLTLEKRAAKFNLKPDRADVIVPAAEIFITIAEAVGASFIEVPSVCLSDGIIEHLYKTKNS